MGPPRKKKGRTSTLFGGSIRSRARTLDAPTTADPHEHESDDALNEKRSIRLSSANLGQVLARRRLAALMGRGIYEPINVRAFLAASEIFGGLTAELQRALAEAFTEVSLLKDDVLYRHGDVDDGVYLIVSGQVALTVQRDERELLLDEPGAGAIFGEFAMVGGGRRSADAKGLRDTRLLLLSTRAFNRLLADYPIEMGQLGRYMTQRVERLRLALALRTSESFRDLDDAVLRDLCAEMELVRVPAGAYLARKDQSGSSLFLVVDGRLRVWPERAPRATPLLREIGPGECVDAIGVITGQARAADIKALRESVVGRLDRTAFERLLRRHPEGVNQLSTAIIAHHYKQLCARTSRPVNSSSAFALVPLGLGVPIADVARALARSLSEHGSTLVLDATTCDGLSGISGYAQTRLGSDGDEGMVDWLHRLEFDHQYIVYVADPEVSNWSRRCLREADHVLMVGMVGNPPAVDVVERALLADETLVGVRRSLVLVRDPATATPRGTEAWLSARRTGPHHHVRHGNTADFDRLARIITGRAVGLVLGGGGARGFAHVGVLRAMENLGIPIDMVAGTSFGAVVAAQWAALRTTDEIFERTLELCMAGEELTIPLVSLFAGGRMWRGIDAMFGDLAIEDLTRKFFCVSCNLSRARVMVHDRGSLTEGVLASNTPPGLFPPRIHDGDLLVDGCLLNNVPADVMERYVEGGRIVAVDVSPKEDLLSNADYDRGLSGWKILEAKLNPLSAPIKVPSIIDIMARAAEMGSLAKQKLVMGGFADVYLAPPVGGYPVMGYVKGDEITRIGYDFAAPRLADWWDAQQRPAAAKTAGGPGQTPCQANDLRAGAALKLTPQRAAE